MKLYNTLSRQIEEFEPISSKEVKYYTCGPTVYDNAHIGNLRTYLFEDFLHRVLEAADYKVLQVMNITDVDDKTIRKSGGNKVQLAELTRKIEADFIADLDELNILRPTKLVRATESIDIMVNFIEELMAKGYAYKAEDGSIYFSIDKFENYGKLSKIDKSGLKSGARVAQDEYSKENPADFALWKAWDESDGDVFWETSLGKGRPGWHIECSAMSQSELGETLDIHAGAVDLIFPHHENEIAQSEARTGKEFSRFWVHGEHLMVDGEKMSKSLGNLYTLKEIKDKGFSALDFRYLVLGAHYRTRLNLSWKALEGARNARERLGRIVEGLPKGGASADLEALNSFREAVENDLDTPAALAIMWEMLRSGEVEAEKKWPTLKEMDKVLGLRLGEQEESVVPEEISDIAEERKQVRISKDFEASDRLRNEIAEKGYVIEDLPGNEYKIIKK